MTAYHDLLHAYLVNQRWFSGKGRGFKVIGVEALPWLSERDPRVRIEIVTVQYADGKHDTYQFPAAYLELEDASLSHARVGVVEDPDLGDVVVYDAVWLKSAADLLLDGFRAGRTSDSVRFRMVKGAALPEGQVPGMVMRAEQSNTSIAYAEEVILKLFRRISVGGNPDIEIHDALTRHGGQHIAPLLGWIEATWTAPDGGRSRGHLGMLQVFLRTATDGWDIAMSSLRDLLVEEDLHPDEVGGDFAAEAQRLGEATARVHADLAAIFDTTTLTQTQASGIADAMAARLDAALLIVPELDDFVPALRKRFAAVADISESIPVQRIHGDLHLGQTLRTVKEWKIIDFEGEPAKSLADRVAPDSTMRDVAGMLRSFDYAAGASVRQFGVADHLIFRATEWSLRNRRAFMDGYVSIAGDAPGYVTALIDAYECDKAVYEAVYEARNRPTWLAIPLAGIARIASEE